MFDLKQLAEQYGKTTGDVEKMWHKSLEIVITEHPELEKHSKEFVELIYDTLSGIIENR